MTVIALDDDQRYRAVVSRDARFDGWFIVGVTSTGIYCRPSCPAPVRPKRANVRFFAGAAAAQRNGFRACKRCRPDATPGSPAWDQRGDLVGRAMRLIADGVVDREGVAGLADRLAVSERHLHRLLTEDTGAGPLAIARAHRAQTARILVETTDMRFADVAFAAGFSSIRQFNDTMREVFATSPRDLRRATGALTGRTNGEISVRLPFRAPLAVEELWRWASHRAIPGLQWIDDTGALVRSLRLPGGGGVAELTPEDRAVRCRLRLERVTDLAAAVERCRRLLDLDADPNMIDPALAGDPQLAALVAARPGLRAPGSVDGFETAVFAVLGQQISVRGACRLAGRMIERHGTPIEHTEVMQFPSAEVLAEADLTDLGLTTRTQSAVRSIASRVVGGLSLDPGSDRAEVRRELLAVHGVGSWTADYVALRALRDPDVLPAGDLVIRRAAGRVGLPEARAALGRHGERWAPWRSYVAHHLWASAVPARRAGSRNLTAVTDRRD